MSKFNLRGKLTVTVHNARNLSNKSMLGKMDPYTVITIERNADKFKTKVTKAGHQNPSWEQSFIFNLDGKEDLFHVNVWSQETLSDDHIGRADVSLDVMDMSGKPKWYPLMDKDNFSKQVGEISISLVFDGVGLPENSPAFQTHKARLGGASPAAASPSPPAPVPTSPAPVLSPQPQPAVSAPPPMTSTVPPYNPAPQPAYSQPPPQYAPQPGYAPQQPQPQPGYPPQQAYTGYPGQYHPQPQQPHYAPQPQQPQYAPPPQVVYSQPPPQVVYSQPPPPQVVYQQAPQVVYTQPPPPTVVYTQPPPTQVVFTPQQPVYRPY